MKSHEISLKNVLAYAPMSNRRAQRMVGKIKKVIGKLVVASDGEWESQV